MLNEKSRNSICDAGLFGGEEGDTIELFYHFLDSLRKKTPFNLS